MTTSPSPATCTRSTFAPVRESGFLIRREDTWTLGYSPDGLVGDDGLIEVKAPRPRQHLRTILSGEVPAYHMPQIQAGLLVTGREWIDFISYVGGMPLWVKRVSPTSAGSTRSSPPSSPSRRPRPRWSPPTRPQPLGLPMTERVDFDAEIQVAA
jgi:hypothetical protein